ncbi:Uncharacterised protein [uncultured Clostridium sp.]|nr:hypothetical protein [uncultured Clostridium sp.]SCI75782.1 Uncharacterised protein [uncultured Clostridium sp.]
MRGKKYIGFMLLFLTTMVKMSGTASIFSVGIEEMPESMKKNR